jgi:hypothetical protein
VRAKTKNTPYRRQGRAMYTVSVFFGVTSVHFLTTILKPPGSVEVSFVCTDRDWVRIYHLLRISTEPIFLNNFLIMILELFFIASQTSVVILIRILQRGNRFAGSVKWPDSANVVWPDYTIIKGTLSNTSYLVRSMAQIRLSNVALSLTGYFKRWIMNPAPGALDEDLNFLVNLFMECGRMDCYLRVMVNKEAARVKS